MTLTIRRILMTAAAAALLGLCAFGLVQAGLAMAGGSGSPASPVGLGNPATSTTGVPTGAAAGAIDTAGGGSLAADLDAVLAADQTTAAATAGRANAGAAALRRLAIWRHLVHGTVVVDLPKLGGLMTVQLDHGTISAVSGVSVTIAETGGGSITVGLGGETRVRKDAAKAAIGDLKTGDEAFVLSKVEPGGTSAYLVVVPRT